MDDGFSADCCQLLSQQYYWRIAQQVTSINLIQTGTKNAGFFMQFLREFPVFLAMHATGAWFCMRQACPFWPYATRAGADPEWSCNCIKTDP
ncbi:TPA: hypothetical protein ACTAVU_003137 [Salmonella enterica subsp. enterica serovar Corvallis]